MFRLAQKSNYTNGFIANIQSEIEFVLEGSLRDEGFARCTLNNILVSCIAEEKRHARAMTQCVPPAIIPTDPSRPTAPPPEPAHLILRFGAELEFPVKYKNESRMFNGVADYTLWYDDCKSMGTNLVVVEAKRRRWTGHVGAQVVACMGE